MATKITLDGYDSYSGADIVVTAQLSNIDGNSSISKKCYVLGSLQTISISTYQDKSPVRSIGNINAKDYVMGPRSIAGSLVFAVFDRHFAYDIFNDLKEYTGQNVLLSDEIPPLDFTLCFQNEYGKRSRMTLYGVKMISEGQVMSINDMFTENTYQFVGTGLENLTPEDSAYPQLNPASKPVDPIISPIKRPIEPFNKIDTGSKYDWKPTDDDDNNKNHGGGGISDVEINQPIIDEDYGNIIIGVNNPNAVNIYMTNKYEDGMDQFLNSDMFDNTNKWTVSVPEGVYNLISYDKETGEKLNEVNDIVIKYQNTDEDLNDYPLINYISESIIEAEINNPKHNQLTLVNNDVIVDKIIAQKNKCVFYNLTPSTRYELYSSNSNNENKISKVSVCSTLESKYETENDFKTFVLNNSNLWKDDLSTVNYDSLNIDNSLNLLDKIMNMDYEFKNELLLYAIIYQNDFLKCANSENDINIIYNYDVLNPYFTTKNAYKQLIFYFYNNNDYYYGNTKTSEDDSFEFVCNKTNKRYYTYALDSANLKSLKYDFYNYSSDIKDNLNQYKKLDINLNDYNYGNYKEQFPVMSENLLDIIIYKDYNLPKYSILDAPKISYDLNKEQLYVKLDFSEYMDENKTYYLCICKQDDVFQNIPIIKISIDNTMTELMLNKYKTHILKDNYYLVYIENENSEIISSSTILSSYTDSTELSEYKYENLKVYLNQLKASLLNIYSCRDLIESVYLSVLSYESDTNNVLYTFIQELLNEGVDSLQYSSLDSMVNDLFDKNFNDLSLKAEYVTYTNNVFTFDSNKINTVVLDFYINDEEPTKEVFTDTAPIDLNSKNSYYTVIYGVHKTNKTKTGYFIRNNIKNRYYYHKLNINQVNNNVISTVKIFYDEIKNNLEIIGPVTFNYDSMTENLSIKGPIAFNYTKDDEDLSIKRTNWR